MTRRTFRAMGTDVELLVQAAEADGGLAAAEAEFHRLERLLTRFDPASELSQLNEKGSLEAGPDLLEVVRHALAGRSETAGRFDPTVHDAAVEAGYDRTVAFATTWRAFAPARPALPTPALAPAPPPPAPAPAPPAPPPPPPAPPRPTPAPSPIPHPLRTSTSISTRIQPPQRKE